MRKVIVMVTSTSRSFWLHIASVVQLLAGLAVFRSPSLQGILYSTASLIIFKPHLRKKSYLTPLRMWVPLKLPHMHHLVFTTCIPSAFRNSSSTAPGWRTFQMPQRQIEASFFPRGRFVIFIVCLHILFCSLRKKRRCQLKLASLLPWAAESVLPKGSCWGGVLRDESHQWGRNYLARWVCLGGKRALTGTSREDRNAPQGMYKIVSERLRECVQLMCA